MRKIYFLFFCLFFCAVAGFAQARLVLNGAYMRIANGSSGVPAYLVIDNSNPAAITRTSNGGLIISEGEFNKIKWNIGSAMTDSATYWFHLGTSGLNWMPFKIAKTAAGAGSGSFEVSSWYTLNNGTVPSGGYLVCPSEDNAMDRFWVINVSGYTTNPTCDLWFYYFDDITERDNIPEGDLVVQHGNSALSCKWDQPWTTTNDVTNNFARTNGVTTFSPFTLGNRNSPLPIELLSFSGNCDHGKVLLQWTTATEINNAYFTVERSADGEIFESIGMVQGAGNSNTAIDYEFTDSEIANLTSHAYQYRLKQTDFDGTFSYSGIIALQNCEENENDNVTIFIGNNEELILTVNASDDKKYDMYFYDNLGRRIHSEVIHVSKGFNTKILPPKKFATGVYYVTLVNEEEVVAKKLLMH